MSLYFSALRLTSFLPYRGEHQVDLGPGAFALVAERDGDPRRSNAQGKSALLWALRFVLTGDHPMRTEDEWITRGEQEGGVDAELSDGTFASRWRRRGTRRRGDPPLLKVLSADGREMLDDEAQAHLDRIVGLSPKEQRTTWWCEQGKADLLVNGDPGEATADVVRWCGVEPVRRAAKRVSDDLRRLLADDARLIAVAEQARAEAAAIAEPPGGWDADDASRARRVEDLRSLADADRSEAERALARRKILEDAARHEQLSQEEARLRLVPPLPAEGDLEACQRGFDELRASERVLEHEERERARLARGEFDGVCPVGGIECPAKERLNADARAARERLDDTRRRLAIARRDGDAKGASLSGMRTAQQAAARARARLDVISPEVAQLQPAADAVAAMSLAELGPAAGEPASEGQPAPLEEQLRGAERALAEVRALRARLAAAEARAADAEARRAALAPDIAARREALQVLGPSGAQRRLVDGFLDRVGSRACEDLAAAGIDMRVSFSWQRELADLADACAQCGQPLPSSRKVRACEACGAERGRKIEQKLRCEVWPKSGGMDALAGIGVRLSSMAWLRARRGSSWSAVAFDEPLAAVDAHNRMLVGYHLAAMLSGRYGIDQAFVSAHDPGLLSALPRRLVVRGSERGSSLEVVA